MLILLKMWRTNRETTGCRSRDRPLVSGGAERHIIGMESTVIQPVPGQGIFHAGSSDKSWERTILHELQETARERARDHEKTVCLVYETRLDVARETGTLRERMAAGFGALAVLTQSEHEKTRALMIEQERDYLNFGKLFAQIQTSSRPIHTGAGFVASVTD